MIKTLFLKLVILFTVNNSHYERNLNSINFLEYFIYMQVFIIPNPDIAKTYRIAVILQNKSSSFMFFDGIFGDTDIKCWSTKFHMILHQYSVMYHGDHRWGKICSIIPEPWCRDNVVSLPFARACAFTSGAYCLCWLPVHSGKCGCCNCRVLLSFLKKYSTVSTLSFAFHLFGRHSYAVDSPQKHVWS